MEVDVVAGGYWRAIESGWLVVPAAESGLNFFVDAVADRLHNFGFDHAALRIDRHFNYHIAYQVAGKLGAVYRRIWIHYRIGDVDLMAGDRSVNHGAQRRSGAGVAIADFLVG